VLMTIAGIATVAVALSLFGGILMLSKWVDHGTEKIKGGVTLEIFMKIDATKQQIATVQGNLDDAMKPGGTVASYRHLSKTDAYEEFKRIFRRQPDLVSTISAEDLPESFRVAPRKTSGGPDIDKLTDTLKKQFESQQGVASVTTPGDALKGLVDVTDTVHWIFLVICGILLLSSLFLIVNTIRLATFARRREIEVMKLVGASNWFVRVPFLAEGMVQGLVGAGLAIIAVLSLKHFGFDQAFSDRASFFSEFYVTTSDATWIALLVLFGGMLIGTFGAVVGLRRFLRT